MVVTATFYWPGLVSKAIIVAPALAPSGRALIGCANMGEDVEVSEVLLWVLEQGLGWLGAYEP